MDQGTRYPEEVHERAVRMLFEHRDERFSEWAAIRSIASKFGMTCETLRRWDVASVGEGRQGRPGRRPGPTTDERERLKGLATLTWID